MAEIVRTETRKQKRFVTRTQDDEQDEVVQVHVAVKSYHGRTAGMVRDFVAALDAADAPAMAYVEGMRDSTGHLVGLRAEWTRDLTDEP